MTIPSAGGMQSFNCLDAEKVPVFVGGIEVAKCRPAIRERAAELKEELEKALADYAFRGVAVNPRWAKEHPGEIVAEVARQSPESLEALARVLREVGEVKAELARIALAHDESRRQTAGELLSIKVAQATQATTLGRIVETQGEAEKLVRWANNRLQEMAPLALKAKAIASFRRTKKDLAVARLEACPARYPAGLRSAQREVQNDSRGGGVAVRQLPHPGGGGAGDRMARA